MKWIMKSLTGYKILLNLSFFKKKEIITFKNLSYGTKWNKMEQNGTKWNKHVFLIFLMELNFFKKREGSNSFFFMQING